MKKENYMEPEIYIITFKAHDSIAYDASTDNDIDFDGGW